MKTFEIKVTGSGTQDEIVDALRTLANDIVSRKKKELSEGVEMEDGTLFTEIEEEAKD